MLGLLTRCENPVRIKDECLLFVSQGQLRSAFRGSLRP